MLTPEQIKLFANGTSRRGTIDKLRKDNAADTETLHAQLVGKRILKNGKTYEITNVDSDWSGGYQARGYRILKNGKRGSLCRDIGRLSPACFEGVE